MKDAILIVILLGSFASGFFLMGRLDSFLGRNCKTIQTANEAQEPSCVLLTEESSDEEIAEEIRRFRSCHAGLRILLYDGAAPQPRNAAR